MVTALAIAFVVVLVGTIFYGFGLIMRRPPTAEELRTEKCSLCGNRFPKEELVERQIGDYKLYYFCQDCIASLHDEMNEKDAAAGIDTKKLISDIQEKRN